MKKPLIIYFNDEKMVKSATDQSRFLKRMNLLAKGNSISISNIDHFKTLINNLPDQLEIFVFIHIMGEALGENISLDNVELQGKPWVISLKQEYPRCKFLFVTSDLTRTKADIYDGMPAHNITDLMDSIFVKESGEFQPQKVKDIKSIGTLSPESGVLSEDISILSALTDDELKPFRNPETITPKIGYEECQYKHEEYQTTLRLYSQNRMGMVDASIFTSKVIKEATPKVLIMPGVCGGRKSAGVKLYDIIIPETALDIVTGQYKNKKFIPYGYSAKVDEDFIKYIKGIVSNENFIQKDMYNLIPNVKYDREKEILKNISIHFDVMACGPFVLKTDDFLEQKATQMNHKIKGFEMESYGVLRTAEKLANDKLILIVKSVMDYTDSKKSDIQIKNDESADSSISSEAHQEVPVGEDIKALAAYMSSVCIKALLPHISKYLKVNNI